MKKNLVDFIEKKVWDSLNLVHCYHCGIKLENYLKGYFCSKKCRMFHALKGNFSTSWGPTVGWCKRR